MSSVCCNVDLDIIIVASNRSSTCCDIHTDSTFPEFSDLQNDLQWNVNCAKPLSGTEQSLGRIHPVTVTDQKVMKEERMPDPKKMTETDISGSLLSKQMGGGGGGVLDYL